jgi:Holliday junction resolvasome RuvABC endonuclease subunit
VKILALDFGTRTGWALWNGQRRESGVQVFDVKRGESPGMRYLRFNRWLEEFTGNTEEHGPDLIVYEQVLGRFAHGGAQTEIATGFATRVMEFCSRLNKQHTAVYASTLKKWATGKGNSKKPEMIRAAIERFGREADDLDDNEADAICLLEFAKAELVPMGVPHV